MLTRNYPEAQQLFNQLRKVTDCVEIDRIFGFVPAEFSELESRL
jgi:hypothetical protein